MPDKVLSIGRGEDTDIRVNHDSISRVHLGMRVQGDHVELIDNDSTNGLYIDNNGKQKIARGIVKLDDVIMIGSYVTTPRKLLAVYRPSVEAANCSEEPFSRYIRCDSGQYRRKS